MTTKAPHEFNVSITESLGRIYSCSPHYLPINKMIWVESERLFIEIYECRDLRVKKVKIEQFFGDYRCDMSGPYIIKNDDIVAFIYSIVVKSIDMSLIYNYVPHQLTQEYAFSLFDIDIMSHDTKN